MFRRCGPRRPKPSAQPIVRAPLAERLLSGETAWFERLFEIAQRRHPRVELASTFGDLSRQSDHEAQPVLQIPLLGPGDKMAGVQALVPEQYPGQRLHQPGVCGFQA